MKNSDTGLKPMAMRVGAAALCSLLCVVSQAQDKVVPDAPKPVFGAPIRLTPPAPVKDVATPSNLTNMGVTTTDGQTAAVIKPVVKETWNVVVRDITLSSTVSRWGMPGGYQVLWSAAKDLPAMNATYSGSFEDALEALMMDTKYSGYPLHACLYTNKVVRILHATQSCNQ